MTPLLSLDDHDLLLVALALESFADQSKRALGAMDESTFMRSVRDQLQQQIDHASYLLERVNTARRS